MNMVYVLWCLETRGEVEILGVFKNRHAAQNEVFRKTTVELDWYEDYSNLEAYNRVTGIWYHIDSRKVES